MNLAQELLTLEKQKEDLLKKSQELVADYYFCFITTNCMQFGMPLKSSDSKKMGIQINFEIIDFETVHKSQFNSSEITTTIKLKKIDNQEKISFENSGSYQYKRIKSINSKGLFFINNYNDLDEKQKKESIKQIQSYYEKAQDPYDDWAIPSLSVKNIVGYIKKSKIDFTLDDLITELSDQVKDIVEKHISKVVVLNTPHYYNNIETVYELTKKEKQKLIKTIIKNLVKTINQNKPTK